MALSNFDKFFLNFPSFDRQPDFDKFWEKSISESKKIPLDTTIFKNNKKTTGRFAVSEAEFSGSMKSKIKGDLLIPRGEDRPKVIIHIHDYNMPNNYQQNTLDNSTAYYFMTMRGHDSITEPAPGEEKKSPGYMIENILEANSYYVKSVYLDLLRCIDMLRLMPELNCKKIGLMGKGLGAAAAIFGTVYSERICALVLDTISFAQLDLSQNLSTGDAANEINDFLDTMKGKKKLVKTNLSYVDALNFSDRVKVPTLVTVGFKDTVSPPECIFGVFNRLLCDKTMEVFPEEGNTAGGEQQFQKSIKWLVDRIKD